MRFRCDHCDIVWFPYMYKEFDACPKCGGGTRTTSEPGSLDAESEYAAALRKRRERDVRKANELAFEEYWEAWCNNERDLLLESVQQDLDALPVAEPRRDLAT